MNERPRHPQSLTEAASLIALRVGVIWAASFLAAIYGIQMPILSHLSTFLAVLSIFVLNGYIYRYRVRVKDIGLGGCFSLALLSCLFSGLVTDAVQYIYFAWLDNGLVLAAFDKAASTLEFQELWSQMEVGISISEMQQMMQKLTIKDIVGQFMIINILLALPVSLLSAPTAAIKRLPEQKV